MSAYRTDIWIQFYPGDYLKETQHLTTEEHGAYLLLLIHYWCRQKPIPDDEKRLAAICRLSVERFREVRDVLGEFFELSNGEWRHLRFDRDIEKANENKEKASNKARHAATIRWEKEQKRKAEERKRKFNEGGGRVIGGSIDGDGVDEGQT